MSPVNLSFSISGLSNTTRPLSDTVYENLSVKVLLEDGTTQLFDQVFKFEAETSKSSRVQVEGTYVDLDKVVEISINGQILKEQ